jgi:hypothetical protein
MRGNFSLAIVGLLICLAILRISLTYGSSQAYDEPCHVAAGLEWLQKHTYTLDPVHPPLSRIAIGLPVLLGGARYPEIAPADTSNNYNVVGNSILYGSSQYLRNLRLARIGVLPFFVLAVLVVYVWARQEFGDFAGITAAALFTTLPPVLAFSSIAYTDIVAASTQSAALLAFTRWLQKRTMGSAALLGISAGLALAAKFTTLLFLPAAGLAILVSKAFLDKSEPASRQQTVKQFASALLIAVAVLWSAYSFEVGHVRESMNLSVDSMPSFQHFPGPLRSMARKAVATNITIPAPSLVHGLAETWVLTKSQPRSYLFGETKAGGWFYFFFVAIGVKSPIAFLLLVLVGAAALIRNTSWTQISSGVSALAILAVSMMVKYQVGVRHVLVVFPLLAVIAGYGCKVLWNSHRAHIRSLLVLLLFWQALSSFQARSDYLSYFNELAGNDPSRILSTGCDLECGQDIFRLADVARANHISHLKVAVWSTADLSQMGLPELEVLPPYQHVSGWVAIGMRSLRNGDVSLSTERYTPGTVYPSDAFAWIGNYRPVAMAGRSIRLYYIPY